MFSMRLYIKIAIQKVSLNIQSNVTIFYAISKYFVKYFCITYTFPSYQEIISLLEVAASCELCQPNTIQALKTLHYAFFVEYHQITKIKSYQNISGYLL